MVMLKASSTIYKAFDFGLKNELNSYFLQRLKGTGVTISYDMYTTAQQVRTILRILNIVILIM